MNERVSAWLSMPKVCYDRVNNHVSLFVTPCRWSEDFFHRVSTIWNNLYDLLKSRMTGQSYTILDRISSEWNQILLLQVQFLKLWLIFWTKLDKNIAYEQFCEQTRLKTALNWCDTNRVSCMWILTTYKEKPFDGYLKYVILCKCNFEPIFLNVVT